MNQAGGNALADEESDQQVFEAGRGLLELAEQSRSWVSRRIEHIEFDDHQALRKLTTLDLSFDALGLRDLPKWRGRALVPVKLLRRDTDFDATVFDLDQRALPQLNRRLERSLVAAGVVALTIPDSKERWPQLAGWAKYSLDPDSFAETAAPLESEEGARLQARLLRYHSFRYVIAALDLRHYEKAPGAILRVSVAQSQTVPISEERGVPSTGNISNGDRLRRSVRHPLSTIRSYFDSDLSWEQLAVPTTDDLMLTFELDEIGGCESFHFELVAPPGAVVKSALFNVETARPEDLRQLAEAQQRLALLLPSGGEKQEADHVRQEQVRQAIANIRALAQSIRVRRVRDDDVHYDRVHLFASLDPDEEVIPPEATVLLRPMTMGTTRSGLISSFLATIVLVVLWGTIGWEGSPAWSVAPVTIRYESDLQSVVAMLLLGPTLFLASVIREREHLMTKRVLERHRRRLVVQAILSFTTAVLYALGPSDSVRWWVSVPLVVTSAVLSGVELRSYLRSWRTLRAQERLSKAKVLPIEGG